MILDDSAQDLIDEIASISGDKALVLRGVGTTLCFATLNEAGKLLDVGNVETFKDALETGIMHGGMLHIIQFRKNETFHYAYRLGSESWELEP